MRTAPATAQAQNGAIDISRFRHPIEFLFEEHDRQRVMCAALELLAHDCTADRAQENAALVLGYLEHEMPLHIADEEEDLFPLLTRRCAPEDEFEELAALLSGEHETDEKRYLALLAPLRAIVNGLRPPDPVQFADDARAFAVLQRRHLGRENGAVLSLARRRLTAADRTEMGRKMAERRGISDRP
jgi:hemerythrin-like domain-containing protein